MSTMTREIHLASRPQGWPTLENFRLVEVEVPDLADGQVLVHNIAMSVDPYMRGRMNDVKSYSPPFALDQPLEGGAVGRVVASRSSDRAVGDIVLHGLGWRDDAVVAASATRVIDTSLAPADAFLGALGMTGLTAYAGITAITGVQPGDIVFVSGAAGAVGSLAGQIARQLGAARVIGSAGSPAKVAYVLGLGFDAAFDYHDGSVAEQLEAAAPDGIDVYFDNVGGEHLEAALSVMNVGGRVAMCGAIAQYNSTEPTPAPRNLMLAIGKQLTLKGFLVGGYWQYMGEFVEKVSGWIADGTIRYDETIVDGLENAPQAFMDLLDGANTGKMLVRL